jgi:hypothetical protein
MTNGTNLLDVKHVGYTQFVRQRQPKNVIRISFVSGAAALFRVITNSAIFDSTRETLTLNANWPATYTVAEIDRIEYVEKVRIDTDDITLDFDENGNVCRVPLPLLAVFE